MSAATEFGSDDKDLVARIVAFNDTRAFGLLVERHQSHVRNFLRKLTRDDQLADDLSQDTFMHAWDKIAGYKGTGSVIGWLLKVAYTTFLQSKRKSRRYNEILEEVGQTEATMAERTVTDHHEVSDLDRLLAVLDQEERAVMVMSYACGLSHREISEATGQPVGTVKSIIFRGKQKIRQRFEIQSHQHG